MTDHPLPAGARLHLRRLMTIALLAGLPFCAAIPPAAAHTWPTGTMTVVHPWTDPVKAGTRRAVLRMGIVEIQADDRLLRAVTDVAERIELVLPDADGERIADGLPLVSGHDLVLAEGGAHFVLHDIRRDLNSGNEYSLTLYFEHAGAIDAAIVISPHD